MSSVTAFLLLIGLLVFVHELGHFLVAKWCGVRVEQFSLGFGPAILSSTRGETTYKICMLPLGGYVKMTGESDEAGVFVENVAGEVKTPFEKGDTILSIDGADIAPGSRWNEIMKSLRGGETISETVVRRNNSEIRIKTSGADFEHIEAYAEGEYPRSFSKKSVSRRMAIVTAGPLMNFLLPFVLVPIAFMAGIYVPSYVESEPIVGEVAIGSPAYKAGIKPQDKIVSVAGKKVSDWKHMAQTIRKNGGREIDLEVARDGAVFKTSAVPVMLPGSKSAAIGITPKMEKTLKEFGLVESFTMGVERAAAMVVQVVSIIFGILFALINGEMSPGQVGRMVAGPLFIAKMSGAMAEQGIASLLMFASFISVNLAVVNLLPIPVLDGGHMAYLTIEAVRKKPLSRATLETAQKMGFSFLIVIMLVATYNDIANLWDDIAAWLKNFAGAMGWN